MNYLHWFMFRARPLPIAADYGRAEGAFIDGWIRKPNRHDAEDLARREIAEQSWSIEKLEEHQLLSAAHYNDDDIGREYFEQALADGICLVFH
jgi:hypothetical protein